MIITLFYIPVGSNTEALALGKLAVEKRLAACANVFPIQSIFPWKEAIQQESEFVLVLKTLPSCAPSLRSFVFNAHSYDLPCIISWDVNVNDEYAAWVKENVDRLKGKG